MIQHCAGIACRIMKRGASTGNIEKLHHEEVSSKENLRHNIRQGNRMLASSEDLLQAISDEGRRCGNITHPS
jgi:hypothetical protein